MKLESCIMVAIEKKNVYLLWIDRGLYKTTLGEMRELDEFILCC